MSKNWKLIEKEKSFLVSIGESNLSQQALDEIPQVITEDNSREVDYRLNSVSSEKLGASRLRYQLSVREESAMEISTLQSSFRS